MNNIKTSIEILNKIKSNFIGLDTTYTLANGEKTKRVYLDSTASTLMMGAAHDAIEAFYDHYANTHSLLHFSAKISTEEYSWAHNRILTFLGADPEKYACFFTGSGTTGGVNRLARIFRDYRPERDTVLVSLMEHHSNDLPHRKHSGRVIHLPLDMRDTRPGCINLESVERELIKHKDRINYIAVTAVSNVTGIINPIYEIAELAHKYDALILVDGAQAVAHLPVKLYGHLNPGRNIDAFVFSGHKTYVPGSPGVVVCRKDILSAIEPEEVGGGMVDRVYVDRYTVKEAFPDREEAGTPNIPGAIGLAAAIEVMDQIGMDVIFEEETAFIHMALDKMKNVPEIQIYGETDCSICERAASISFNIKGLDHGLVAAALNDYYNIAVRNECFCAHPYVKEMIMDDLLEAADDFDIDKLDPEFILQKQGMVRASFGLYSTESDIDALVFALEDITLKKEDYKSLYVAASAGNYIHKTFRPDSRDRFSIRNFVADYLHEDA
mgnify:CR=1 FL=1